MLFGVQDEKTGNFYAVSATSAPEASLIVRHTIGYESALSIEPLEQTLDVQYRSIAELGTV